MQFLIKWTHYVGIKCDFGNKYVCMGKFEPFAVHSQKSHSSHSCWSLSGSLLPSPLVPMKQMLDSKLTSDFLILLTNISRCFFCASDGNYRSLPRRRAWTRLHHHVCARYCSTTVVKGHCGFLWEAPTLTESETPKPIDTKVCTIDYVGDISSCAKNHNSQLHEGATIHRRTITFRVPFSAFSSSRTTRT